MKEELKYIGFIKKPHGINGEIKLKVEMPFVEDLLNCKVIFIELNGQAVPYFVESLRFTNNLLIKLEDVDTKEEAHKLSASPLLIRTSDLIPTEDKSLDLEEPLKYHKLIGYTVIDSQIGRVGLIDDIQEYPQQEMALVEYQGKTLLLPLHPELIKNIDEAKKEIILQLPEGMLNL